MTAQVLVNLATMLTWAVVAYRLPPLFRQPRDLVRRTYWLSIFLFAVALTVLLPGLQVAIATDTGIPYLAHLLGNGFVLASAWATQASLYHVTYPTPEATRQLRRVAIIMVVTLSLMASGFALATRQGEAVAFTGYYHHASFLLGYRLVYLVSVATAIGNFAHLSWRRAQRTPRPASRLGLRLVTVAGVIGIAYVANEGLRAIMGPLGGRNPLPDPAKVSQVLIALGTTTGLIGTTMPAWGPRLGIPAIVTWFQHYRALRRLYPLWADLYRAQPKIALFPSRSQLVDVLSVRDLRLRLYHRAIEIRDGQLLLRRHLDPRPAAYARQRCAAAGLPESEIPAIIEATEIAAAQRATPHDDWDTTLQRSRHEPPGTLDVAREVAALEHLARCYRRSSIVRAVVAQLDREDAPAGTAEGIIA